MQKTDWRETFAMMKKTEWRDFVAAVKAMPADFREEIQTITRSIRNWPTSLIIAVSSLLGFVAGLALAGAVLSTRYQIGQHQICTDLEPSSIEYRINPHMISDGRRTVKRSFTIASVLPGAAEEV
jgi:hypothetical protein